MELNYKITGFTENLFLITLPPVAPGFENFIGTWLYKGDKTFIVDVGSSSTAQALFAALDEAGITHLDYIFLTHIHVDHAGAAGDIAARFAGTPIICHKDGIPHLADPERLWKGTIKTLGNIATAYGPINPVPIDRLVDASGFNQDSIISVMTPGHSVHHISYIYKDYLFAGEAGGVYYSLPSGGWAMRPATPPKFFYELAYESIDALVSKNPVNICYGHLGLKENAVSMLKQHQSQLALWKKIIGDEAEKTLDDDLLSGCTEALLRQDPFLSEYSGMEHAVREREMIFLTNSIKGFIGYIKDKKKGQG
uniref:Metallo-beta-lactamase domain-containing protein n=1 Tax=uncultured Desulfobacterium sp. TaxID=201089 RepID=E1YDW8_9BACT|nr:hypothetical protein N47_L13600 [uncultured Desulfobacterium sp.]